MAIPKTTFSFIWHFVRQQRLQFGFIISAFVVWSISDAVFPYLLKHIVNTMQVFTGPRSGIYAAVSGSLIILVTLWILSEVILRGQGFLQMYTFPKFRANIRAAVFDYVKFHSHEYFASHFAGSLAKKIADLPTSCQSIVEIVCFQLSTTLVGSTIVLVLMWLTNPLFAMILFIWICMHLSILFLFLRYGNHLSTIHADSVSELSGKVVDVFTNMLNVRLFARTRYETNYLQKYQRNEIKKARKALLAMEIMRIGLGFSGLFLIFSMLFILMRGWVQHWVMLGDFTQIMMQSIWLMGWMWFLSFQLTTFAREQGTIENALSLIRKGHDLTDKPSAHPIDIKKGEITFKNVNFTYQKNRPVFENLTVTIPAGKKIGLVGFSGSGKSTFVNLILRFYDLQGGEIDIDGDNIADVTQESLRAQIAMIPQDAALFHRSLMENIRYGRLDATDEEVIQAAKLAHCHEFIEKLEYGYDALVGERGIKLSGGQRQRIAIARAILKNAPILILDEATSSLDSVTEKLIQESLLLSMQGRTTIVIAHRLSTLTNMDTILVFHKGQIIEAGSKKNLLKAKGHFANLWNMQTDGFLPENDGE